MPDATPATGTGQLATDSSGQVINYAAAPQGSVPMPNTANPVPSGQITNGTPLNIPQTTPPNDGSALVASTVVGNTPPPVTTSPTSATDSATTDYTQDPNYIAANQQNQQGIADYKNAANGMLGQGQALTNAENAQGVPDTLNKLQTINTQIAEKTAAFHNASQNAEVGGIQSGTPAVFYQGQQAAINRQSAVEIGGLSAVKAALQGNYQLAESRAQQTVKTQFADAQQKLTNTENFLKLNQNNLNNAEKIATDKIRANMVTQKAQLTDQMANRKFALTNGVQSQFYTKPDGTVVRTEDGQAFSTPQQAFAAGVLQDFSNAPRVAGVGKSETKTINGRLVHITYDQSGQNVVSQTDLGKAGNPKVGKGGRGGKGTTGGKFSQVQIDAAGTNLQSQTGTDGAVSPDIFNQGLDQWKNAGGTAKSYWANYGKFTKSKLSSPSEYRKF